MIQSDVNAFLAAVEMMNVQGPRALVACAEFAHDGAGPLPKSADFCEHLEQSTPNDVLRRRLHVALARWDASDPSPGWASGTAPNTRERRVQIMQRLDLDGRAEKVFADLFPIANQDAPIVIAADWEPWYRTHEQTGRDFYWRAYSRYLHEIKGWDAAAVEQALDVATTCVVERLANPTSEETYQSKGLVVGYVQSGKTANFTGVIAKAIDAGYRLIIVLTGTTDLLRAQTQRRLDMELVGKENLLRGIKPDDEEGLLAVDYLNDDNDWPNFLEHGVLPADTGHPDIHRLTTRSFDYKRLFQGISGLDFERREKTQRFYHPDNLFVADARLAVVKKNAAVLRKLVADLKKITAKLGDIPTLIIDDESDQASVNTTNPQTWGPEQKNRTAINKLLAELLRMLPRAQYVGYTATPFANVFIDPSDAEDIFPKDFLIALSRTPGYMGAADFHDMDDERPDARDRTGYSACKAHVRFVKARTEGELEADGLSRAMDTFVLTGAVKLYREAAGIGRYRHHTMLVHENMKKVVHREQAERLKSLWDRAGYRTSDCYERLQKLYETDISLATKAVSPEAPVVDFSVIFKFVGKAAAKIGQTGHPALVVNSDKIEGEALDFDRDPVWRILIGGNKLARGFTVEGLTVTYYRRDTKQADTLMQMGRWFGFRPNYQDLVRLYTTPELYEAFEAICEGEMFFREELEQYADFATDGHPQVTPAQIPPLVAQHLRRIRPTAANKMYNAELAERRTLNKEPTGYPPMSSRKALVDNAEAFLPLIEEACKHPILVEGTRGSLRALQVKIPHSRMLDVLEALSWGNPECFRADLAWLKTLSSTQVADWSVLLPQLKNEGGERYVGDAGPLAVYERAVVNGVLKFKSPPSDRPVAEAIAEAEGSRTGAMLLYPTVQKDEKPLERVDLEDVVMAFRLVLPRSAGSADGRLVTFVTRNSDVPAYRMVDV